MKLIVAVDKNWAIGLKGKLLVSIPSDLKRFKEFTTGNVIVLGRKTIETFPGGMPLKNRTNIILSSKPDYKAGDAIVAHSIDEVLDILKSTQSDYYYVNMMVAWALSVAFVKYEDKTFEIIRSCIPIQLYFNII